MEPLLSQSRRLCPFLKKTSPSTLRALSTGVSPSVGGGTMSNLQVVARRCPVMSKALAVQSVRNSAFSTFGVRAGIAGQKRGYVVPSKPAGFQATERKDAEAASIETLHLQAGVLDTSKGIFSLNCALVGIESNRMLILQ
jgi:5-aminolevulinate synthase